MSKPDGGPISVPPGAFDGLRPGISLRDYFAAAALQGWLATYGADQPSGSVSFVDNAMLAYRQADAMLAERDK